MKTIRPLIIFGTRPEWIKLSPLVRAFRESNVSPRIVFTGQHESLARSAIKSFNDESFVDLCLMTVGQSPQEFLSRALVKLCNFLESTDANVVFVQGDTATALAGGLAGFYKKILVAHVEAGLRTNSLYSPFPEEGHRRLLTRLTEWHFCPTAMDADNLASEGIDQAKIHIVGNTVIDSLRELCERHSINVAPASKSNRVLVTLHRRESFGGGLRMIALAISKLAELRSDYEFILPLHPNPVVGEEVLPILNKMKNIRVIEPLPYVDFIRELSASRFVISDSGGVQEEAPYLGRPLLIVRDLTERPQAVESGASFLCGTRDIDRIVEAGLLLADDTATFRTAAVRRAIFGDGYACQRIVGVLKKSFGEKQGLSCVKS